MRREKGTMMEDAQLARQKYIYDASTGVLRHAAGQFAGRPVGRPHTSGYLRANFNGRHQDVHRLVWLYVHGVWPDIIDHINHDKSDNRIENLRSVTRLENQRNRALSKNNKSGVNGVRWNAKVSRWVANIKINGTNRHIGHYEALEDAIAARRGAEMTHGFHEYHGRASWT